MRADTAQRSTLVAAVLTAVAASACCVGPLVFAALGLGGAGLLVAMAPYRPAFTVVTLGLLAAGFCVTYGRRTGADCDCERPRTGRTGRRLLWIATGVATVALLSPSMLAGTSLAAALGPATPSSAPLTVATLLVEGMTCPSCEGTIQAAVGRWAGVGSVAVRFADGSATVQYDPAQISADELAAVITELGYPTSVHAPEGP